MMENVEKFLNELSKLTKKYGIGIGGCGCCGSPFMYSINTNNTGKEFLGDNLYYDCHKGEYTCDR